MMSVMVVVYLLIGFVVIVGFLTAGFVLGLRSIVRMFERLLERVVNVQSTGFLHPPEAIITSEESPEARAVAHFSEETIEAGVRGLRNTVYANSGLAMPGEEELRAEVISMLAGMTPEPIVHGVRVRG